MELAIAGAAGDGDGVEAWRAGDPGPLPEELRGWAENVLAAQSEAIASLERRRATLARQLLAIRSVPSGNGASSYLDVSG